MKTEKFCVREKFAVFVVHGTPFILQKGSNPLPEFVTHEQLKNDSTNFESVCDMEIIVK